MQNETKRNNSTKSLTSHENELDQQASLAQHNKGNEDGGGEEDEEDKKEERYESECEKKERKEGEDKEAVNCEEANILEEDDRQSTVVSIDGANNQIHRGLSMNLISNIPSADPRAPMQKRNGSFSCKSSKRPDGTYHEGPSFSCELCGNIYLTKKTMERHKVVHAEAKPFRCEECGQRFFYKFGLTA